MILRLCGYQIADQIYESSNSLVYRGYREADDQPVILKILRETYPSPERLAWYKREYNITHNLNLPGVIQAYALETDQQRLVMVLEDFGGTSLTQLKLAGTLDLEQFLQLAISITQILGQIHATNIIHKDINPSNIVFNPTTGQIKIIDFGISTVLSRETQSFKNPNVLEGTIAYISPEQTGRMNRVIDYRSDFYSLGVTFYELLTGQVPFQGEDALALVHCHIAKQPLPPHEIIEVKSCASLPPVISDIILKLMAKNAEDRYQSAYGIQADLRHCLHQLQTTGTVEPFPLRNQDVSDRFSIPQKLYGRQPEIETLLAAFDRVSNSTTELMLVAGYSGIGKSALVTEIYKPITEKRGYFISGKFDQLQRDIPYSAITSAFTSLVRQLLTESEQQLNQWREKLHAAVSPNGQVIIDVIPEVQLIIGEQPEIEALGSAELQNRFNIVFQNFIRVFGKAEHPLVIFLDDLQWADSATLKLIELIMTDTQTQFLFLIGAYRDNEVTPTHPLMMMLEGLRRSEAIISQIDLSPLALKHISQLSAETLHSDTASVEPLAELVLQKTRGNPFFVNEFLKILYQEDLLIFHQPDTDTSLRENGYRARWQWNIEQIEAMDITNNVVCLMLNKLKKLPKLNQSILRLAACIGSEFDLNTLSMICEKSHSEIFQALRIAVHSELILPTSARVDPRIYQPHSQDFNKQLHALFIQEYKFVHDRIQQAAYALIDDEQKKSVHLKIGRLLLKNLGSKAQSDRIFEVSDHLNLGRELMTDKSELLELAQLNLEVSQKAKDATAYRAALQYLKAGIDCLIENCWSDSYSLTFNLYKELADVEYLNGNFEQSERIINLTLSQANSALAKAEIYNMLIVQYSLQAKYNEALKFGRQGLQLLGIELPNQELKEAFELELAIARENLGSREISSLLNEPEIQQLEQKLAIKLLMNMDPPAYFADLDLYPVVVVKMVNISLKYGPSLESSKAYCTYGIILGSILGDYQSAYKFGIMALKLSERFKSLAQKCQVCEIIANYLLFWTHPIKLVHSFYREGYEAGLKSGELHFVGYNLMSRVISSFYQGIELNNIMNDIPAFLKFTKKTKNSWATDGIHGFNLALLNLIGMTEEKLIFVTDEFSEKRYIENCQKHQSLNPLCHYHILKAQIFYLYGDYIQARMCIQKAEEVRIFILGYVSETEYNFYESLILVSLCLENSELERKPDFKQVVDNQKKMKIWAENCPDNFLHKYLLVSAEMARISGNDLEAMDLYDQAIASADRNGFIQNTALGNELAAKFWLSKGKEEFAQLYLRKAHYGYQLWGAKRKVEDLEQRYPQFFTQTARDSPVQGSRISTVSTSDTTLSETLDLNSVLKASQALGREIKLDTLLTKLMRVVIENAGAQTGYLLLNQQGQWQIQASGTLDSDSLELTQPISIEIVSDSRHQAIVSNAIVNYVIRTNDSVVLHDAANEGNFTRDPYIQQQQPKSILCSPLLNQGTLIGILYLENNLTTGAFTPERVELLNLLSSQAAISIENATLYNTLEQKVAERTQQLSQTLQDLQATQKQLVESEKMAALGSLVAGVAHEINTPVGTSITVASTLADETRSFIQAVEQGQLKRSVLNNYLAVAQESSNLIVNNLHRAGELVQSFKQVAVDQTSLERRKFRVKLYLEEILISLTPKLKNTSHTLRVEGDETVWLDSYPGALAQLVTNLVMNSLTHAYQPGEAGQLCLEVKRQGQKALILYSDDGCGIAPENLSRIFEPFFTTARQQGGSGLGLHIVYNLVTQTLQGMIAVHSEVKKGTLFTVTLPLSTGD